MVDALFMCLKITNVWWEEASHFEVAWSVLSPFPVLMSLWFVTKWVSSNAVSNMTCGPCLCVCVCVCVCVSVHAICESECHCVYLCTHKLRINRGYIIAWWWPLTSHLEVPPPASPKSLLLPCLPLFVQSPSVWGQAWGLWLGGHQNFITRCN